MTKKIQSKTNLLRHSKNVGVLGAALSHVVQKTAMLAPVKIILQTMPKTMKTPLSQLPNRMNGRMSESALMSRPLTKNRKTVIIFLDLFVYRSLGRAGFSILLL